MERPVESAPPQPFDAETWRGMVELVNFLGVHKLPPDVQDRLGQAIVQLRRLQLGGPATEGHPRQRSPWSSGNRL